MTENENLKPEEIRKAVWGLNQKRSRLQSRLMSPPAMVQGCLHKIYKKCGNPKCYCATGKKHGPYWAISRKIEGRTKLTYVSDKKVIKYAAAHKRYNKDLARL